MANDKQGAAPWYRERWPWILMAGPAIVIVAGVVTVWLAIVSNDGLVADDYYKQGLAVNQQLHRDQAAAQLGLRADLMLAEKKLRLILVAEGGAKLPAQLPVKFGHPTVGGMDQTVILKSDGGAVYTGDLVQEIDGRWLVSIEDPDGQWRLQGEWVVRPLEPLRLSAKSGK